MSPSISLHFQMVASFFIKYLYLLRQLSVFYKSPGNHNKFHFFNNTGKSFKNPFVKKPLFVTRKVHDKVSENIFNKISTHRVNRYSLLILCKAEQWIRNKNHALLLVPTSEEKSNFKVPTNFVGKLLKIMFTKN